MKRLVILLLILTIVVSIALPFAMPKTVKAIDYDYKIPFTSSNPTSYITLATTYIHPGVSHGSVSANWTMPVAGVWSHLIFMLDAPLPVGDTATITFYKNGAPTALTVSFAPGVTQASDLVNEVSCVVGDTVCIQLASTGFGGADYASYRHSILLEPDTPGIQPFFGDILCSPDNGPGTNYTMWSSIGGGDSANPSVPGYEWQAQTIVPINGKFKYLYTHFYNSPPTATDNVDFVLRVNGVSSALSLSWRGTSEDKSDLITEVPVVAGDLVNFQAYTTGPLPHDSHYMVHSICFIPDDPSLWWIARPYDNDPLTTTDPQYSAPSCSQLSTGDHYQTTEDYVPAPFPDDITITGITFNLSASPGAGKSRTITLRKNAIDTAITLTISDADTFGAMSASVTTTSDFDMISICETRSGAVNASRGTFALVGTASELPIPVLSLACAFGTTSSYENITTYSNDNSELIGGADWSFESILATGNHTINVVTILAFRIGNPTTLHVDLFDENTTTFVPVGTALASGEVDVSAITTDTEGEWVDIALTPDVSLIAGQYYDLVVSQDAAGANDVVWNCTYKDVGNYAHSHDSGTTWGYDSDPTPRDGLFVLRYCLPIPAPDALHIIAIDQQSISLAWQESSGIPTFQVVYKLTGYPADQTDGTIVYFDNITSCTVDNLTSGVTYYFGIWSYFGGAYSITGAYCTATTAAGWPDTDYGTAIGDTTDETILGNSPVGGLIDFVSQYSELPEKTVGLVGYSSLLLFMLVAVACYNRSVAMTLICGVSGLLLGVQLGVFAVVFLIMAVIFGLAIGTLRGGQPSGG